MRPLVFDIIFLFTDLRSSYGSVISLLSPCLTISSAVQTTFAPVPLSESLKSGFLNCCAASLPPSFAVVTATLIVLSAQFIIDWGSGPGASPGGRVREGLHLTRMKEMRPCELSNGSPHRPTNNIKTRTDLLCTDFRNRAISRNSVFCWFVAMSFIFS